MSKQKTFAETPSHTDTSIITASDAALRYIASLHGAEVPFEPFSAAVTAQALASALHPYKTPHGREADSKMVKAISTTQLQADPAAAAVGKLRMLLAACNRIEEEAEEFEGPDGLEMGITTDHWHEFAEALTAARKALAAAPQAAVAAPLPPYDTFSNDDGDSWQDCPDDAKFVNGRQLGEEFELLAGWQAERVTFRVTKVPDDESDDYEVEEVTAPAAAQKGGEA